MPSKRGTAETTLSRAHQTRSSSATVSPTLRIMRNASSAVGNDAASSSACCGLGRRLAPDERGDPACAVRVILGVAAAQAGADDLHVLPALARGGRDRPQVQHAPDQDEVAVRRGLNHRTGAVRRRQHEGLGPWLEVFERRVAEVEAGQRVTPALAPEHGVAELLPERLRLLHLGAAVDRAVSGVDGLDDRGRRAQHVDHDSDGNPGRLPRCKRDVDAHWADVTR